MVFIVFIIDILSMMIYTIMTPFILIVAIFCCDFKIVSKAEERLNEMI